jgi:hypothetical protein
LETVEPIEDEAPPFHVDDAWEEEVVVDGPVTAGVSMSLQGDAKAILAFCESNGINIPGLASSLTARRDESNIFGSVLSK